MAKSIFEILADLQTETSVPEYQKEKVKHSLPRNLFPTTEIFEDESALLDWATENGCVHALLQKGIQDGLIECRAIFKYCPKNITWTPDYGQKNINKHEWKITTRGKSGNKVDNAVEALSKLSPEQLAELMARFEK